MDGYFLIAAGMVFITVLLGYFLGCLNGSVMVSHFIIRDDVRQHGSGNAGLTNFYRTYGAKYALGVILFDMGKTVIACLLGGFLLKNAMQDWTLGVLIGGLGCELGHMFPVFFGFKGGKGILSGGTLVWLLDWRVGLIVTLLMIVLLLTTKYMSLATVTATLTSPILLLLAHASVAVICLNAAMVLFVAVRHRANFARLRAGIESKFSFGAH